MSSGSKPSSSHEVQAAQIRLGTAEEFALLKSFLDDSGYTPEKVCQRMNLPPSTDSWEAGAERAAAAELDFEVLRKLPQNLEWPCETPQALDLLIRLFLLGGYTDASALADCFPRPVFAAMQSMGLLQEDSARPEASGRCFASFALYPTQGLHIVSDRWNNPDASPMVSFADIVFPAITKNTRHFLETLPREPCENFLDLCSGTGIAALVAASRGIGTPHAWAVDITERSTQFCEFNRRLNGVTNLTALRGDLYAPFTLKPQAEGFSDHTFDRIVAHPPYMPSLKAAEIYYDGGADGESVTRRIVEGLAHHLRPGGRFYGLALGADREQEPIEQRIRGWLGSAATDFDLLLVVRKTVEPAQFGLSSAVQAAGGTALAEQWKEFFQQRGIESLIYSSMVIQRRTENRGAFTVRRRAGSHSGRAETEWLLRWESTAAGLSFAERLLEFRPVATPHFELRVTHRMKNGELVPENFLLTTDYPFSLECAIPPWTGFLLARCDGTLTAREHFDFCKQNRFIQAETPAAEFARYVGVLVSGGFLEIPEFALPCGNPGEGDRLPT